MGIHFYTPPMYMPERASWYSGAESGESVASESEETEELEFCSIKFNELMREPVSAQLRTILNKDHQAFTKELLGDSEGRKSIDIWA